MENLHITILKDVGGVGAAAVVTVYDAGTEDVSTIYSDDGSTAAGNPLTADAYGRTNFYAANGSYDIKVTGTGITEYTLLAIKLFDVKTVDEADTDTDKDKAVSNNLAKTWEAIGAQAIAPITLEYKLYRSALSEAYIGYIDCQLVISTNSDFSAPDVDLDTATAQTSWLAYCAASASFEAWSASGMVSTDVRSIVYTGASLTRGTIYYYRWRTYKHGDTGTATDYKSGVLCQ